MHPRFYYCATFKMNFYFFIGWKPEKFQRYLGKYLNCQANIAPFNNGKAMLINHPNGKGQVTAIWTAKRDASAVVHECVHAANFTLESIGHIYSYENDEVMAYLVTRLFDEAMQRPL